MNTEFIVQFNKMKDELPAGSKSSTKVEESKTDEMESSTEQVEGKSDVKPPASHEAGAPSEGNVSTAAAAALASAAVKAKVYNFFLKPCFSFSFIL